MPLPLRLHPGQDLRLALQAAVAAQGGQAAFVLSGIGSLQRAPLRLADARLPTVLAGPLELLSLAGSVGADHSHLHATVADGQGRVWGGHVSPGCLVHTTAELLLVLLPGWQMDRQPDPATGYDELRLRPR